MIEKISKMDKIMENLRLEGKTRFLSDDPNYWTLMEELNEQLLNVRREYIIKDYLSNESAKKVILTEQLN